MSTGSDLALAKSLTNEPQPSEREDGVVSALYKGHDVDVHPSRPIVVAPSALPTPNSNEKADPLEGEREGGAIDQHDESTQNKQQAGEKPLSSTAACLEGRLIGAGGEPSDIEKEKGAHTTHEESSHTTHKIPDSEFQKDVDLERGTRSSGSSEKKGESSGNEGEKEEVDPNIVDWDGPDDPANARNWTEKKKWGNILVIASITFLTPLASSMFAPGVPDVMREFDSSNEELASFVVSVYVLGYAFGPIILAPLSELYGRLWIYNVCNLGFVIFTIACAVSSNLNMLIGFRFIEGLFGSCPLTIGGGTIADMVVQEKRGGVMAIWALGPLMGPVVGPVAGGYLTQAAGWRWVFWVIAIAAGAVSLGCFFFCRESYAVTILEKKASSLRKSTGNPALRSKLASPLTTVELFKASIVRPMKMLLFSPIVLALSTYMAVVYGYLYLLFTTITEVFETTYHFSSGSVGLTYLGIGIGCLVGVGAFGYLSDRILKMMTARNGGEAKPEFRLPPMIPGSFTIPIGLFLYGWTAENGVQWIAPIIGTSFVGFGLLATYMPIQTYMVDAFTVYAASAIAANAILRSLVGALLPLAGRKMYATLGLGWGNSLLGFIALAMCPIPYVLYRFGEGIRKSDIGRLKL